MKNKKGFMSIYFAFIILAILIVTISAVLAPMGVRFNTEMYRAGEMILNQTNASLEGIENAEMKAAIMANIDQAIDAADTNIEVRPEDKFSCVELHGLDPTVKPRKAEEALKRGYCNCWDQSQNPDPEHMRNYNKEI